MGNSLLLLLLLLLFFIYSSSAIEYQVLPTIIGSNVEISIPNTNASGLLYGNASWDAGIGSYSVVYDFKNVIKIESFEINVQNPSGISYQLAIDVATEEGSYTNIVTTPNNSTGTVILPISTTAQYFRVSVINNCDCLLTILSIYAGSNSAENVQPIAVPSDLSALITWTHVASKYQLKLSQHNSSNVIFTNTTAGASITLQLSPMSVYYLQITATYANNSQIDMKILPFGTLGRVVSFVGATSNTRGYADANRENARFSYPRGMTFNTTDSVLYLIDAGSNLMRKINLFGEVSTLNLTSTNNVSISLLYGITQANGVLYFSDYGQKFIASINLNTQTYELILNETNNFQDSYTGDTNGRAVTSIKYYPDEDAIAFSEVNAGKIRYWKPPFTADNVKNIQTLPFNGNLVSLAWGFTRAIPGVYYFGSSYQIVKSNVSAGAAAAVSGTTQASYVDGYDPRFAYVETLDYDKESNSIYLLDSGNNMIRRRFFDGYVVTLAGGSNPSQFVPGLGTTVRMLKPAYIYMHPIASKYIFISDDNGVRVMYGDRPLAPQMQSIHAVRNVISVSWSHRVPYSAINNITITMVGGNETLVFYKTNLDFNFSTSVAGFATNYKVIITATNEYGTSVEESADVTTEIPAGPTLVSLTDKAITLSCTIVDNFVPRIIDATDNTVKYIGLDYQIIIADLIPMTAYRFYVSYFNSTSAINSSVSTFSTSGKVVSIAGHTSENSYTDGLRDDARFTSPIGMDLDTDDYILYINDMQRVRKVDMFGSVSTLDLPQNTISRGFGLSKVNNSIYIGDYYANSMLRVNLTSLTVDTIIRSTSDYSDDIYADITRQPTYVKYYADEDALVFCENTASLRYWKPPFVLASTRNITTIYKNSYPLASYSHARVSSGVYYMGVTSTIVKIDSQAGNTTVISGNNSSDYADGYNPRYGSIDSLVYHESSDSLYIADSYNRLIRRRLSDGYVISLAGSLGETTFKAGIATESNVQPIQLYPHPYTDKYIFITDNAGLRVMYGGKPLSPKISAYPGKDNITVTWKHRVPYSTISNVTLYVSGIDRVYYLDPINSTFTITGLQYITSYSLSISATNEYGTSDNDTVTARTVCGPEVCFYGQCNATGQCQCNPLVTGYTCAICPNSLLNPATNCTTCSNLLMNSSTNCATCIQNYYHYPDCFVDLCATRGVVCDNLTSCYVMDIGGANCTACPSGYNGTGLTKCSDVNECETDNGNCASNQVCVNTIGSHECRQCGLGYTPSPNGNGTCIDINECDTKNGGCDYHVSCKNTVGGYECPNCPRGYSGSSYIKCTRLCGDGTCDATLSEDCVSCPFDCHDATCNICGDGTCNGNETCTSCYQDCKQNCTVSSNKNYCGSPACSNRGTCVNGVCQCTGNYTGVQCSDVTVTVQVIQSNDNPSSVIATTGNTEYVSFKVSISRIYESNEDGTPTDRDYYLEKVNFTYTEQLGGINSFYYYNATLENQANLFITVQQNIQTTTVYFANTSIEIAPNILKLNTKITNWPFLSLRNKLNIVFDARDINGNAEACNYNAQTDQTSSVKSYELKLDGSVLYGQFFEYAVVDTKRKELTFRLGDSGTVTAISDHFWEDFEMDPIYGVLLEKDNEDSCSTKSKNDIPTLTIIIVVVVVVGVGSLVVIYIFAIHPKVAIWAKTRESARLMKVESSADDSKGIHMDHLNSNETTGQSSTSFSVRV